MNRPNNRWIAMFLIPLLLLCPTIFCADDWPLRPLPRPPVPEDTPHQESRGVASQNELPASAIDRFLAAKWGEVAIHLVPGRADSATLLRRLTLTVTGLMPTPAAWQQFQAWERDLGFERAWRQTVRQLLQSPQYGQHWGRHWLDLVRYGDSDGFRTDRERPYAYLYRDYVIASFNADKPADQFLIEQLAGDESQPQKLAALIATGFYRQYPDEENATNVAERRQEILNEISDLSASLFLGITLACARCHDHPYDDWTQKDYFQWQAFFAAGYPLDLPTAQLAANPLCNEPEMVRYRDWWQDTAKVRETVQTRQRTAEWEYAQLAIQRFPEELQRLVDHPSPNQSPLEQILSSIVKQRCVVPVEKLEEVLGKQDKTWLKARRQLDRLESRPGLLPPYLQTWHDIGPQAPETRVLATGNFGSTGPLVEPAVPARLNAIFAFSAAIKTQQAKHISSSSTGRRFALAGWLTDAKSPLTARVLVNRLWQHHFGVGLVPDPNDFGSQGGGAIYPELIDWLAGELIANNWRLKAVHEQILCSQAYVRAADLTGKTHYLLQADPHGRYVTRWIPRPLPAEATRDCILQVAGLLTDKSEGPPVRPPLPAGQTEKLWPVTSDRRDYHCRSVFLCIRRSLKYPWLDVFHFPDSTHICARRAQSITPLQSLALLNGEEIQAAAQALARELVRDQPANATAVIESLYQRCYTRKPTTAEIDLILKQLHGWRQELGGTPAANSPQLLSLCRGFSHALLMSQEFLTIP